MKEHKKKYLKDYRPPEYFIDKIDLRFDLKENNTKVFSEMQIRRNNDVADENTPLVFNCDLNPEDIISVIAEDMVLLPHEYEIKEKCFVLQKVPEQFTLEVTGFLHPERNTGLEGLYKSGGTFCTQCEAEGFRKITCFPDRPDVMTRFSCIITADREKYPVLLSNGNLIKKGDLSGGRHFVQWEDPFKKPCYLFALVAGNLVCIEDSFTTCSGRDISLKIYVEPENKNKCGHAMKSLKQAMKWDEKRFGREYDLDLYQIVAVNDFNMGAMENKGLNIFNSKYVLAKSETATDMDFMNIQGVIAHEYFHNWTGNRITLKNWFQLSLKEGLTVFRDQEFSSDMNSRGVKRINTVKALRTFQFPEDAGPMAHPVRPEAYIEMNNFYTTTVYNKGAELIRMVFQILGKTLFRKGMDLYFEKFDGQAITIEDFIETMEDVSGTDLSQFMLWYCQPGTPVVRIKRKYHAGTRKLYIHLDQHIDSVSDEEQKKPVHMHIPVKIGFINKNGVDITDQILSASGLQSSLFNFRSEQEELIFSNVPPGTIPSIFREFSAPVKIENDFSLEETAFLMANDKDEFNRWNSAQQLFLREISTLVEKIQQKKVLKVSDSLNFAFEKALNSYMDTDRALLAAILTIPDENEIAGYFKTVDVDAIHGAWLFLKQNFAERFHKELYEIIKACSFGDSSDLSSRAVGDRSLKNLALSYLGFTEPDEKDGIAEMIYNRFLRAATMTDEIASLSVLCNMDSEFKENALERFYSRWKVDPLVIDKWFGVQAASILPDTFEKVEKLSHHPDFSLKNPNRIRSLAGVFAMQNPVNFHRSDGRGYGFIGDIIMTLDHTNPQIAARLVSAFNNWKKYDSERQTMMRNELEKIMALPSLSTDVYEIVSNALK